MYVSINTLRFVSLYCTADPFRLGPRLATGSHEPDVSYFIFDDFLQLQEVRESLKHKLALETKVRGAFGL